MTTRVMSLSRDTEPKSRAILIVLALGALLAIPALATPFFLDDYLHSAMARGSFPVPRAPWDLYDFVDDGDRAALFQRGLLPWWSDPKITIRFFRPLSSALLFLDHRVFGTHPFPMHVHSLLWWMAAVLSVRALFDKVLASKRAVFVATLVFALAPCHAVPLAWLANREVLLALTFGALALPAYARFREEGGLKDALTAALLFALAVFAGGEYSLCFGGYVVAIDLVLPRMPLRSRVLGWMPFAIPAGVYMAVRSALHYGTFRSGFYSDPMRDPARFFVRAPTRFAALLCDAWISLDTSAWFPPWQRAMIIVIAIVGAVIGVIVVRRAFASLDARVRSRATWLLFGSLVSLVPVLPVVPSTRLLGVAMIGVSAVVAIVLDYAWFGRNVAEPGRARTITGLAAIGLGFAHLVHGPVLLSLESNHIRRDAAEIAWRAGAVRGNLRERDGVTNITNARIGVVRGKAGMFFAPFAFETGAAQPAVYRMLMHGGHVLVVRKEPRVIELVTSTQRSIYPEGELNLYRSEDVRLVEGDTVTVPGLKATILRASELGPSRVRIAFDDDLDAMAWFNDGAEGMERITLPQEGMGAPLDP
jgi:hypothetical protein